MKAATTPPRRRDRRRAAALLTLAAVLLGGLWLDQRPATQGDAMSRSEVAKSAMPPTELQQRFDQAVVMLNQGHYDHAVVALHRVLTLAPKLPEAHVNMGFALLGLKRTEAARDFFESATLLKPDQANAYYGLALAWEASGDLPMATGAMRSYLHLARSERPEHLRRARAALWEWEQAREPTVPASAPEASPASRPAR